MNEVFIMILVPPILLAIVAAVGAVALGAAAGVNNRLEHPERYQDNEE